MLHLLAVEIWDFVSDELAYFELYVHSFLFLSFFLEIKDELSCMESPLLVNLIHDYRTGNNFMIFLFLFVESVTPWILDQIA